MPKAYLFINVCWVAYLRIFLLVGYPTLPYFTANRYVISISLALAALQVSNRRPRGKLFSSKNMAVVNIKFVG